MWRIAAFAVLAAVIVGFPQVPSTRATGRCTAQWRVLARPIPTLDALTALSATDVWALGHDPGWQRSVIAHWNGVRFRSIRGAKGDLFTGIAAVSHANVWAVGVGDRGYRGFVEHWNGRGWRRLRTPRGGDTLNDIVMESRTSGWAVGSTIDLRPLALRWNGRSWKRFVLFRRPHWGELHSVAAASANDVWAVGQRGGEQSDNTIDGFAVHWNGHRWQAVPARNRDDAYLGYGSSDQFVDVAAVSPTEAWAIHRGTARSDIQHWNGRRWRIVRVLYPQTSLNQVIAFRGEAWAFGTRSGYALLLHWDGKAWRTVDSPLAHVHGGLAGASALSRESIWVGGSHLLARYSCRT
jgi:hypothetical protein